MPAITIEDVVIYLLTAGRCQQEAKIIRVNRSRPRVIARRPCTRGIERSWKWVTISERKVLGWIFKFDVKIV